MNAPVSASRLALHAIDRIERAIGSIDDSDGHCGGLLERARDIHLAACGVVRPDPATLARDLFDREIDGEYDTFSDAAAVYGEVLGEAGLAEYRRLAREAWEKLPPPTKGSEFSEFCLQQGRTDEALRRAEDGLWKFEDSQPDQRLTLFAAGLLTKAGRKNDAEKHLWRAFERVPGRALYDRLRTLGGTAARDRAIALLEASPAAGRRRGLFGASHLLVALLIEEKMFDAAWCALERHGGDAGLAEALADASTASHPGKALAVYAKLVEEHAQFGRYAEAVRLSSAWPACEMPPNMLPMWPISKSGTGASAIS